MPEGSINLGHVVGPTGPQGATGPAGPQGVQGPVGPGVPTGGAANQVLRKKTGTNYDTEWHALDDADIPSSAVSGQTTVEGALGSLSQQIDELGPYNGLDSDSTTAALSAAQGKLLNDFVTTETEVVLLTGIYFEKCGKIGTLRFGNANGTVPVEGIDLPVTAFKPMSARCKYYNGSADVMGWAQVSRNKLIILNELLQPVQATYVFGSLMFMIV